MLDDKYKDNYEANCEMKSIFLPVASGRLEKRAKVKKMGNVRRDEYLT